MYKTIYQQNEQNNISFNFIQKVSEIFKLEVWDKINVRSY